MVNIKKNGYKRFLTEQTTENEDYKLQYYHKLEHKRQRLPELDLYHIYCKKEPGCGSQRSTPIGMDVHAILTALTKVRYAYRSQKFPGASPGFRS